jgi:putative oxygen-independent coproporphyrinogen III oxidase
MSTPITLQPATPRIAFTALPPLALYVHIPWCLRKCPYCDFNSHEAKGDVPEHRYVDALIADLEQALPLVWGRPVHSIFFGGGTPSLFAPESLDRFLSAARALLPIEPDAEITLEANPGTFEQAKFAAFRALGINRLSIGIQSFDGGMLKSLGRVHDDREAHRAVEIAARNFDNFNLDLMYALPGQSPEQAAVDIREAIAAGAPHVSAYHLTIEPNTYFHRYPPAVPDDDTSAGMQIALEEMLAAAGYEHYETSAFARPGRQARHNLNYWRFGDYLGDRGGRARQAELPRPGAAAGAAPASARLHGSHARGRCGADRAGRHGRRTAVRIHDERAASDGRIPDDAVHGTHEPAAVGGAAAPRGRRAPRVHRTRRDAGASDGDGPAVPERAAADLPGRLGPVTPAQSVRTPSGARSATAPPR